MFKFSNIYIIKLIGQIYAYLLFTTCNKWLNTRSFHDIAKTITTLLLQPPSRAISAERHNQLILNLNNKKCLRLREDDQKFLMYIIEIHLGDTMFHMRCCAAADESGYSSDRVKEKKAEKERVSLVIKIFANLRS